MEVAGKLEVTHSRVYRWEKPAGHVAGRRPPGREPVGDIRRAYARMLERMREMAEGR